MLNVMPMNCFLLNRYYLSLSLTFWSPIILFMQHYKMNLSKNPDWQWIMSCISQDCTIACDMKLRKVNMISDQWQCVTMVSSMCQPGPGQCPLLVCSCVMQLCPRSVVCSWTTSHGGHLQCYRHHVIETILIRRHCNVLHSAHSWHHNCYLAS